MLNRQAAARFLPVTSMASALHAPTRQTELSVGGDDDDSDDAEEEAVATATKNDKEATAVAVGAAVMHSHIMATKQPRALAPAQPKARSLVAHGPDGGAAEGAPQLAPSETRPAKRTASGRPQTVGATVRSKRRA